MAGDFDLNDEELSNDNWENSGTDDFYRQADACGRCDTTVRVDDLNADGYCERCAAQPARCDGDHAGA